MNYFVWRTVKKEKVLGGKLLVSRDLVERGWMSYTRFGFMESHSHRTSPFLPHTTAFNVSKTTENTRAADNKAATNKATKYSSLTMAHN